MSKSSVLIRGMEMPKNCAECDLSKRRHSSMGDIIDCKRIGTVGSAFNDQHMILINRHPNCPLIEIRTTRGRLIDADELKKKFKHGKNDTVIDSAWTSTIRRAITAASTIIERSEE